MNERLGEKAGEDVPRARPLAARDAQAALLEQLLGDVDGLVARVEQIAPALEAAAERVERATAASQAAFAANAEAAKASVGEWITRTTNEATARALKDHMQSVDETVAAAIGRGVLAAQRQAPAVSAPAESAGRLWMAAAAGAGAAAVAVLGFWLLLGAR